MKVKALRDKDTKEFIYIMKLGEKFMVFTGEIPQVQPLTATMELMKEIYPLKECEFDDFNNFELVEFDLIEAGEVGADIRNKLSPPKNLVELLEVFFDDNVAYATEKRKELAEIIKREMKQTKISVEYLAKLL